jgi:hypothetical protein
MHRIGITGHRAFDARTSGLIRHALRRVVAGYDPLDLTGVTCLAAGADTLFAQAVADRGGRLEVVVPARRYRQCLPYRHRRTYDELLARAVAVHELPYVKSDPVAYRAGGERMLALADRLVAVWDGLPALGHGGTAEIVAAARALGMDVEVVWPEGARRM